MNILASAAVLMLLLAGCRQTADPGDFRADEIEIIASAGDIMRVLTIAEPCDSLVLRDTSLTFSANALLSEDYARLCSLMIATVTHPSQERTGSLRDRMTGSRRPI